MRHRSRSIDSTEELNIWPAFTDLMSNAFMILVLLLSLALIKPLISKAISKSEIPTGVPPILVIEDEGAYRFASGSAEIPPTMDNYIRNKIVPEIERNTKKYRINVVELIGHTDGQANGSATSNLDQDLEKVASTQESVGNLHSGSNADLGLMRALAVVRLLRDIQTQNGRLKGLKFRAYSAAQLILPNGDFAPVNRTPDATRRRIEIRFTRLGEPIQVK